LRVRERVEVLYFRIVTASAAAWLISCSRALHEHDSTAVRLAPPPPLCRHRSLSHLARRVRRQTRWRYRRHLHGDAAPGVHGVRLFVDPGLCLPPSIGRIRAPRLRRSSVRLPRQRHVRLRGLRLRRARALLRQRRHGVVHRWRDGRRFVHVTQRADLASPSTGPVGDWGTCSDG
jgi:hypothetical protein